MVEADEGVVAERNPPSSALTAFGHLLPQAGEGRGRALPAWMQAMPLSLVFALFFLIPLALVVMVSFWDYNDYQIIPAFTFRNYSETFEGCLAALPDLCTTLKTYVSTAKFCFIVWAITLVIGFTISYFLAFHVRSFTLQMVLALLCTIPFWTSNVIRMISWIPLLGRIGLVMQALVRLHLVDAPVEWLLYSPFSIVLAFVH
ncbi:MAG: ABC transporter permease, partial [Hyphomicrobiales bacterium]